MKYSIVLVGASTLKDYLEEQLGVTVSKFNRKHSKL